MSTPNQNFAQKYIFATAIGSAIDNIKSSLDLATIVDSSNQITDLIKAQGQSTIIKQLEVAADRLKFLVNRNFLSVDSSGNYKYQTSWWSGLNTSFSDVDKTTIFEVNNEATLKLGPLNFGATDISFNDNITNENLDDSNHLFMLNGGNYLLDPDIQANYKTYLDTTPESDNIGKNNLAITNALRKMIKYLNKAYIPVLSIQ